MLVLTRFVGETLIIETPAGEKIEVTVPGAKGNQVRIGIEAHPDVNILRKELVTKDLGYGT